MQADCSPCPAGPGGWMADARADRRFHGVLLIWALACLAAYLGIVHFGASLPWCDEWPMTFIACGQEPLSWRWLMEASNEHRLPLTRLSMFVIGRLSHWDWQAAHYVNLLSMGLGALALLCAARSVRGQSSLSDAFLCLIVLTPWSYQTIWQYGYANGVTTGLVCLALSMVAVRWPQRSLTPLGSYLLTVLGVTLAGGPAGNFLALGLTAALLPGWRAERSRAWKVLAAAGAVLIGAVSGLLLATIPTVPRHAVLRSESLLTCLRGVARASVCWLGEPPLEMIWPWAFLVVLLPILCLAGLVVRDLRPSRPDRQGLRAWADLALVGLGSLLVLGVMAYGRGRTSLWDSRYVVLTMPFAIVLYLLLVRLRAPVALPQTMAMVMAVCCGWCWPVVINFEKVRHDKESELVQALARGDTPLSDLCMRYHDAVGFDWVSYLTNCMMLLRENDQGIFRTINRGKRRSAEPLPLIWKADSGERDQGWDVVPDGSATQMRTLRARPTEGQAATAIYRIQVPVAGTYRMCFRMRSLLGTNVVVAVDGLQTHRQTFTPTLEYRADLLNTPLELTAGEHVVALTLSPGATDLDLVELVPTAPAQRSGPEGQSMAAGLGR